MCQKQYRLRIVKLYLLCLSSGSIVQVSEAVETAKRLFSVTLLEVFTVLLDITFCGRLFQSSIILLKKEYLLMLIRKQHFYNFNVWPLRLKDDLWKNVSGAAYAAYASAKCLCGKTNNNAALIFGKMLAIYAPTHTICLSILQSRRGQIWLSHICRNLCAEICNMNI